MSLKELTIQKSLIESQIQTLKEHFAKETKRLASELIEVNERLNIVNAGLNEDMVSHGMSIVKFGKTKSISERMACVRDAINDIANGCIKLRKEYLGTKDYAHWSDQRIACHYGYGPSHGSVVFRIGLTESARKKIHDGALSDYDIECAIYCLMNIDEINNQKEKAKAA